MSSAPLIPESNEPPPESGLKKCLKVTGLGVGGCLLVVFILVWVLQGLMYAWATYLSGCRPGSLEGFNYDGDADAKENPVWNLMPRRTLLTERSPKKFIMPFYVFPSNDASTIAGGQVGTWWRTWGPLFFTYTYEDMSSMTTIYMRKNLLRLGQSHRIARCDGKEPFVTFTEGGYFFSNRVRKALGYNQAMTYKIYVGDDLVALAEEASGEVPSLTFRNMHNDFLGTSVLLDPNFHGSKQHWLVKNNESMPIPYFVTNAASLLFAFHILRVETDNAAPANFLAQAASASSNLSAFVATADSARTPEAATTAAAAETAAAKQHSAEAQKKEALKEEALEHV